MDALRRWRTSTQNHLQASDQQPGLRKKNRVQAGKSETNVSFICSSFKWKGKVPFRKEKCCNLLEITSVPPSRLSLSQRRAPQVWLLVRSLVTCEKSNIRNCDLLVKFKSGPGDISPDRKDWPVR